VLSWTIEEKRLDLRYNWKISRNESFHKINFFIKVSDQRYEGIGEVAPNIRYLETPDLILSQFLKFTSTIEKSPENLEEITTLLNLSELCNSLRFAIESAFVHYLCNRNNISIFELLKIPKPSNIYTSYTIPIIPVSEVKDFLDKHNLHRFKSIKIKINIEGLELVNEVAKHYKGPLMIDANEAWKDVDDLLKFMEKLKKYPIEFIEQPLPYDLIQEYIYLKKHSPYILIGDESITNKADFDILVQQFHGVNMKLMKAGGYLNGVQILQNARKYSMKTMIGCMIETTLGISSGMNLCGLCDYADLDGHFVIDKEPFQLVEESDGMLSFKK
jgi:L-alanine-DL-glutamate epimerase-like enolase superfamily enzyme